MGDADMNQRITVLVAAYNGRDYIEEQMDSILAQSQGGILLVVSDDRSTDGTGAILDHYGEMHPAGVLVLHRRAGSGGAAAHFLGLLKMMADLSAGRGSQAWEEDYDLTPEQGARLTEASGADYFMLSDQDDVWLPFKAKMLLGRMKELEQEHALPTLVHSDLKVVDAQLKEIAPSFFTFQKISPERTRLPQLLVQNNVTGGAVMINRLMLPFLDRLPQVCLMHDAWLALIASCFGQIGWVDRPLYLYRQHGGNTLGAEQGDSLQGAKARLEDGSEARRNYRLMFGQARCLLTMFYDRLDQKQRNTLTAFTQLPKKSRLGKIALMIRYGFTKNTALRTIGQMLFIGD